MTRRGIVVMALAGMGILTASPFLVAMAQSKLLDGPRADGSVGERFDGFAVGHGAVSASVAALVAQMNAERRAVYAQRAQTDKASVDAVGRIYAAEIMKTAPAKTWFLSEAGSWTQK